MYVRERANKYFSIIIYQLQVCPHFQIQVFKDILDEFSVLLPLSLLERVGYQAGIGVLCGLLFIFSTLNMAVIGLTVCRYFRQRKRMRRFSTSGEH
jgi:hypothetical protein